MTTNTCFHVDGGVHWVFTSKHRAVRPPGSQLQIAPDQTNQPDGAAKGPFTERSTGMTATYQPQPNPQYAPQPRNGFGITALVLALIGAVFALIPFTGFIALILGALAILFGLMGYFRARKGIATNKIMSAISTGLGVLVAAAGIWGITIVFGAVDQLDKDLQQIGGDYERATIAPAVPGAVTGVADNSALADVAVSACKTTNNYGTTYAEATATITNTTDKARSYWGTIAVDDTAGKRLGEIHVYADAIQPGQSTTKSGMEASTMLNEPADEIRCTVVEVSRM